MISIDVEEYPLEMLMGDASKRRIGLISGSDAIQIGPLDVVPIIYLFC